MSIIEFFEIFIFLETKQGNSKIIVLVSLESHLGKNDLSLVSNLNNNILHDVSMVNHKNGSS